MVQALPNQPQVCIQRSQTLSSRTECGEQDGERVECWLQNKGGQLLAGPLALAAHTVSG